MISLLLALNLNALVALNLNALAQVDCSLEAEKYVTTGHSQPGKFCGEDFMGNLIYHVRVNDQGGDAAYEVIVTHDTCSFVSKRLLWTE